MKTYLSGPIFSVSKEEAAAWRNEAKAALEKVGIEAIIPRPFIPGEDVVGLVSDDMRDIRSSGFIISHIPPNTVMAGTPMEIFYAAHVLKIPVYTFPKNQSPWYLRWSTESFDSLEELLEYVEKNHVNNGSTELLPSSPA
jgi:nucleoside 2-deoxyribosyltransferase